MATSMITEAPVENFTLPDEMLSGLLDGEGGDLFPSIDDYISDESGQNSSPRSTEDEASMLVGVKQEADFLDISGASHSEADNFLSVSGSGANEFSLEGLSHFAAAMPTGSAVGASAANKKRARSESESGTDDSHSDGNDNDLEGGDGEDRKKRRLQKNRIAAQQSRQKKKEYVTELEAKVRQLSREVSDLTTQLTTMNAENHVLKNSVGFLQTMLQGGSLAAPLQKLGKLAPAPISVAPKAPGVLFAVVLSVGMMFSGLSPAENAFLPTTAGHNDTFSKAGSRVLLNLDTIDQEPLFSRLTASAVHSGLPATFAAWLLCVAGAFVVGLVGMFAVNAIRTSASRRNVLITHQDEQ
eukprot:GFYU01000477.1.p1 GENE.GFYU01000477.1~~GFYU01000477.1.p1  ORF type:complete len:355 (-),score=107.78 GFYU01000477.1:196-1260(-)